MQNGDPTSFPFLQTSERPGALGRLAHYEVIRLIGQGGFGLVFEAFDSKLQRSVAIKVIAPALAATSPARKRFLREARAAAAVRHRNVVQIYSVQEDPLPYLVMEMIEGQTLQQRSDAIGPMSLDELLCIGHQIASGLTAAHKKELLHRDIKPDNILIEAGNELNVKITDFGLARTADEVSLTRTGAIAGTPMYMSPEQALEQTVDSRADLFSLGSVLYMMATGRPPFRASATLAILKRVAEDTPRAIPEIIPETPKWMCAIIAKLQAKSPDDRFQSAEQVAKLLAQCLEQLREIGTVTAADFLVPEYEAACRQQLRSAKDRRQWTSAAGLAAWAAAFIVMVLTVGYAVVNWPRDVVTTATVSPSSPTDVSSEPPALNAANETKSEPPQAVAPFDALTAERHQRAWEQYLNLPVEYENSLGMRFRLIPPGSFWMGSTKEEIEEARPDAKEQEWIDALESEAPLHEVQLTRPIYMSTYEVTQQDYLSIMDDNPAFFAFGKKGNQGKANFINTQPVEMVTWVEAAKFCNQLSDREHRSQLYTLSENGPLRTVGTRAIGYRLPTEAEWEFACRAGTTTKYWNGDTDETLNEVAWFVKAVGKHTHPVGKLKANPFGLHDTLGNVWEWVEDSWQLEYFGQIGNSLAVDPRNDAVTNYRVIRGGCYNVSSEKCRASTRRQGGKTKKNDHIGFRIVLEIAY